jgi:hypothetical protein
MRRVAIWLCLLILSEAFVGRALQFAVESVVPPPAHAQSSRVTTIADCPALYNTRIETTLTDEEIDRLRNELCMTPTPDTRGTCPAMDNFVNTRLTLDQLRDEEVQLCPWMLSEPDRQARFERR